MTTELKLELLQKMAQTAKSFEEQGKHDLANYIYNEMSKLK